MKPYLFLFIGIIALTSCKKKNFEIHNLNGNQISVIGHGGMGIGHHYPMNSLESVLNCLNSGADGAEIDVQMTKDGVLVAFHDETLENTNISGKIHEKTWAEIKGAYYKYPHYGSYKLIRLEDLFKNIPNQNDYTFFLDYKDFQPNKDEHYYDMLTHSLTAIIDKYNLVERTYIEFKNETLIQRLQLLRPDIKQFVYSDFDYALHLAEHYHLHGINLAVDQLTHERVQLAHSKGIMVSTFNTHSQKRNTQAIEHNVDFIQTDKLNHLIKILND